LDFGDRQEIFILTLHTSELYDYSYACLVDVLSLLSQSTNSFFSYLLSVIVIPPFFVSLTIFMSNISTCFSFFFFFFILPISSHIFTSNIFVHFLETISYCVKVKVTQLCLTLCDPMDCSPPGSSIHGILQARILEWVAIPFSRGSSQPRNQTWVSCIAGRFFTS